MPIVLTCFMFSGHTNVYQRDRVLMGLETVEAPFSNTLGNLKKKRFLNIKIDIVLEGSFVADIFLASVIHWQNEPQSIAGVPNLGYICLSQGVHFRLGIQGKTILFIFKYSKYKSSIKKEWIFVVLLSLFIITNLGVHAHLSKFSRGTWPQKGWEPLIYCL